MPVDLRTRFLNALPPGISAATCRESRAVWEELEVRDDVLAPWHRTEDHGALITVWTQGGVGYAATADLSASGLRTAAARAHRWAQWSERWMLTDLASIVPSPARGERVGPCERPWDGLSLADRVQPLMNACKALEVSEAVISRTALVVSVSEEAHWCTADGGDVHQTMRGLAPELIAVAKVGEQVQRRTLGGFRGLIRQGGAELLDALDLDAEARRVASQAIALAEAEDCPSGKMDVVIAPDQMVLQIHESIGHPLELDRILGDERNYAGTSFVTPEMFGAFQYGSELLNVSFDPTQADEIAAYGFDDDGSPAQRLPIIERGVLLRGLGGRISQARSGLPGVACSRSAAWDRPPIDRMANLNVEPGDATLEELIGGVERGVWMETNTSWSIDQRRDKFQFGCEYAREIVNGRLGKVLRNPNYRGRSSAFWRSLSGVGDANTRRVLGTLYCGKGEPNQMVRVGHATPACRFSSVDVFGGG